MMKQNLIHQNRTKQTKSRKRVQKQTEMQRPLGNPIKTQTESYYTYAKNLWDKTREN